MGIGRSSSGRFEKGNSFGTGRKVSELRKAFVEAINPEDVQAIVQAVVQKAKDGDIKAVQIILPYIIGTPLEQDELRKEICMDENPPFPDPFRFQ